MLSATLVTVSSKKMTRLLGPTSIKRQYSCDQGLLALDPKPNLSGFVKTRRLRIRFRGSTWGREQNYKEQFLGLKV